MEFSEYVNLDYLGYSGTSCRFVIPWWVHGVNCLTVYGKYLTWNQLCCFSPRFDPDWSSRKRLELICKSFSLVPFHPARCRPSCSWPCLRSRCCQSAPPTKPSGNCELYGRDLSESADGCSRKSFEEWGSSSAPISARIQRITIVGITLTNNK